MAGNSNRRGAHPQGRHQEGDGRRVRRPAPPRAGGPGPDPARGAAQGPPGAAARRRGGEARGEGRRPWPSRAREAAARRRRARDRARPQPGGRVPARRVSRPRRCTWRWAPTRTSGSPRPCSWRPTPGSRSSRCRATTSTGSRAARCTKASRCRCPRTSTPIRTTCSRPPATAPDPALIVALDGVTDPRNLGAVVRSVSAFGGHGVIVPQRRTASMTAVAWRTSAGTAARLRGGARDEPDPHAARVRHGGADDRRTRRRGLGVARRVRPGDGSAGAGDRLGGQGPVAAGPPDLRRHGVDPDGRARWSRSTPPWPPVWCWRRSPAAAAPPADPSTSSRANAALGKSDLPNAAFAHVEARAGERPRYRATTRHPT